MESCFVGWRGRATLARCDFQLLLQPTNNPLQKSVTVFMMGLGDDSPPPTAALWAKYVGDEGPESYMKQGMALHMLYGIGAGGAFAIGVTALGLAAGSVGLATSLLWAVLFGLALTVVGAIFWMRIVLAMEPEPKMVGLFAFFHLVYGVVLGTSVASVSL